MNAINHAATALLINKKWPGVPVIPVLVSVQLVEFLWVAFNIVGIEITTTETQIKSVSDIHLIHMPYSHSIAATAVLAFAVWFVTAKIFKRPGWGVALAVAASSHIVLDLAVHVQDIALLPGMSAPKFGSGLYGVPLLALAIETLYGIWCWRVFQGSTLLLTVIVTLNLATLSFYAPGITGPEVFLSGHPVLFSTAIGGHIIFGLVAIGFFSRRQWR